MTEPDGASGLMLGAYRPRTVHRLANRPAAAVIRAGRFCDEPHVSHDAGAVFEAYLTDGEIGVDRQGKNHALFRRSDCISPRDVS